MSFGGSPGRRGFSTIGNFLSGHPLAGGDHLADTRAAASAEIVKSTLLDAERQNVRLREIDDVDVVANAGAVRRFVIGAVHLDVLLLPKRDFEHVRNQVSLAAMILPVFFRGAGGVEIAQRDEFKPWISSYQRSTFSNISFDSP